MVFEFLDLKPRNPYLSLALDEALCRFYARRPDFEGGIRLWANNYSIILGRTCDAADNLQPEFLEKLEISHQRAHWSSNTTLCRRASGGGTVLHGPGGFNYSIFIPLEKHPSLYPVRQSYEVLLGLVRETLGNLGIECRMEGQSDLVMVDEDGAYKKISGNAQFRKHGVLVHHGTLITHRDLIEFIAHYLQHPPREPEYREGRRHEEFLGNLPDGFDVATFYNTLSAVLKRFLNAPALEAPTRGERKDIYNLARKMAAELYSAESWILTGRHPR